MTRRGHAEAAERWLAAAEAAGESITVEGIECYTWGGAYLNIDCPEEMGGAGGSARVLRSRTVVKTAGKAPAKCAAKQWAGWTLCYPQGVQLRLCATSGRGAAPLIDSAAVLGGVQECGFDPADGP